MGTEEEEKMLKNEEPICQFAPRRRIAANRNEANLIICFHEIMRMQFERADGLHFN